MLAACRGAQRRRIDHTRTDGLADRSHRPLHGGEKGGAGVFHQVPPVGDLNRVRTALSRGLTVTGAAVACDHGDRRMPCQPGRRCRGFPIRQDVDDASPFQIADHRPIAVPPLPGKVIDPDGTRFLGWLDSTTPDDAQQGVIAHGQQQALCEALSRSATQCQPQMMNNSLKTRGPACEWGTNRGLKSFGENLPTAIGDEAAEATGADGHHNTAALRWKVGQCSPISAVDMGRPGPAEWADCGHVEGCCSDSQLVGLGFDAPNSQPAKGERNSLTHDGNLRPIRRQWSGQIASGLSLSPILTP